MIRAFLGLTLPDEVRSALAVQQVLLSLPRKVDPAGLHLTLVFLGEVPDLTLQAAHERWEALKVQAFSLSLQGIGLFGGPRPRAVWAGVAPSEPLTRLQARAEHAARQAGAAPETRRFHPHVTLGRFPPPAADEVPRLERAVAFGAGFVAGPWMVQEMVLWESRLHRDGPSYHELARYPFGGAGG